MKSILVPLDGSALAERVLPYVQQLAPVLSANVQLLRVVTEAQKESLLAHEDVLLAHGHGVAPAPYARERHAWRQLTRQAERYLAAQSAALHIAGITAVAEVSTGYPAEAIVHIAAEHHSSLIALATHGYGGVRRWMLGSVADKVIQATTTPVLLIRDTAPSQYRLRRLLVPLDGSALASQALPCAIALAERTHAQVVLLEAIPPLVEAYPYVQLPTSVCELLHEQALHELRAVADDLARRGIAATVLVRMGYPPAVIVETAVQQQADLLVMATHGRGGIRRWALGSVADKVAHAATTPLVLIHAQADADEPTASAAGLEPPGS